MSRRYTLLFVFLIALPVLAVTLLLYQSGVEKERAYMQDAMLDRAVASVQREMQLIAMQAEQLAINPTVRAYLSRDGAFEEQYDEMIGLRNLINTSEKNRTVYSIRLYVDADKFYVTEMIRFFPMRAFAQCEALAGVPNGGFSPAHFMEYKHLDGASVVSCVYTITHARLFMKTVGYVTVDVKADSLAALLLEGMDPSLSGLSMKDENGGAIVTYGDIAGGRIAERTLPGLDWTVSARFRASVFGRLLRAEDSVWVRVAAALVALSSILLVVSMLAVRGVTRRVERMVNAFTDAEKSKELPPAPQGPRLFPGLERAVYDAQRTLLWQREQQRARSEMRFKLLQAQLNPHFLYNTLDNIGWLIQAEKNEEASESIITLAKYLRLTLSRGRDEIPLAEEVEMAQLYLWMQAKKTRFETRWTIEEETRDMLVPKLTLQPILENAIAHGGASAIDVDAYLEDERLIITVCDDGEGIDEARIREILSPAGEPRGFGLYNVDQRAKLFSGGLEDCGISAQSEKGRYSLFTIRLAARRKM